MPGEKQEGKFAIKSSCSFLNACCLRVPVGVLDRKGGSCGTGFKVDTAIGSFATTNGSQGNASQKDPTQVRGAASGVAGASSEALPNIPPLDTRLGLRFHDTSPKMRCAFHINRRWATGR